MKAATKNTILIHPLDRFLAILSALACLVITIAIWRAVGSAQPMWPLPALYFVELILISSFAAILFVSGILLGRLLLWVAFGVTLAFALLGAFSVGLAYLPIALVFAIASFSSALRVRQSLVAGLETFFIAALAQTAVMLTLARLL